MSASVSDFTMAKLQPYLPVVAMARPQPISLSRLEQLLCGKETPVSMLTHIYHTRFLHSNPADCLAIILPPSSLLALRVASSTTKEWVEEHHPDLLKRLCVTCPLPRFSLRASSTFRFLARNCSHLTIKVLPSAERVLPESPHNPSPATQIFYIVKGFSTLRIEPPLTDAFESLVALRRALDLAEFKKINEIHIEPLALLGLLALRWGGFDTFAQSASEYCVFGGLKSLRIGLHVDGFTFNPHDPTLALTIEGIREMKAKRNTYRLSVQALHGYLFQFARWGRLEKLHFEWINGTGPNPLLLDEEIAKERSGWKWFSAPGTVWQTLKEVWLGGVKVTTSDVKIMKERMGVLERLLVWQEMTAAEIMGTTMFIDGKEWLEIDLSAESLKAVGPLNAVKVTEVLDSCEEEEDEEEGEEDDEFLLDGETLINDTDGESVTSMVVPFVLQII
ncbi:MAG: hypothetical protein Q9218_004284 [Villophora microphyllina]